MNNHSHFEAFKQELKAPPPPQEEAKGSKKGNRKGRDDQPPQRDWTEYDGSHGFYWCFEDRMNELGQRPGYTVCKKKASFKADHI
mmetsp:Transcript_20305/g.27464  ORF Transcript_20305/g.27464 Transcript_20305/m.27464 type:complete len:85 (+) Transcript_20305:631-885(+)